MGAHPPSSPPPGVLGRKGEVSGVSLRLGLSARTGVQLAQTGAKSVTGGGRSKGNGSGAREALGTSKLLCLFVFKVVKS